MSAPKSVWFDAAAMIIDKSVGQYRSLDEKEARGCCRAIRIARADSIVFATWFFPGDEETAYWWSCPHCTDEDQEARRLALCFMHWIEQTEGEQ